MAKQEAIPFLTPWMVARFPKITQPDTKGKYADGKFKTDGVLTDEDYKVAEQTLADAGKHFWPDADVVELPLMAFYANADDKKAKKSDSKGMRLKSKYRPAVFDSKKKKLPESVAIGGGSVFRVASAIFPWSKAEKTKVKDAKGKVTVEETVAYGVSLRLGDVQIKKLVAPMSGGDGAAFDENDDGFTYEGTEDAGGEAFGDATDL